MTASSTQAVSHTDDEVLVVMDMEPGFAASQDAITQWFVEQQILRAIELGLPVVVVEYDAFEMGSTYAHLMRHLEGYGRCVVVDRSPPRRDQPAFLRDNAAEQVIAACERRGFSTRAFRVCGVNSDACITATIRGLADAIDTCHITVVQDACNSDNGRDTHVFHDVFPLMSNVTVLQHGAAAA